MNHLRKPRNVAVIGINGQPLAPCSAYKASYLVGKGLAVYTDDDKSAIQLKIETVRPYRGAFEGCSVCHRPGEYTMHHVVPKCILRFLPEEYRTPDFMQFNSVPLCESCHTKYELDIAQFKNDLYWRAHNVTLEEIRACDRLKSTAYALVKHAGSIPEQRLTEIQAEFDALAQGLTPEEVIDNLSWTRIASDGWKQVVEYLRGPEASIKFWVDHYNTTMNQNFSHVIFSTHA